MGNLMLGFHILWLTTKSLPIHSQLIFSYLVLEVHVSLAQKSKFDTIILTHFHGDFDTLRKSLFGTKDFQA